MIIVILVCLIPHIIVQGVCISRPHLSARYLIYVSILSALHILLYTPYSPFNLEGGTRLKQLIDETGIVLQALFFVPAFLTFILAPILYVVQIARYRREHPRYIVHFVWSICLIALIIGSSHRPH